MPGERLQRIDVNVLGAVVLVASALPACADALTEVVVVVDTELEVPGEADEVVLSVTGRAGRTREAVASLARTRPATLALVPAADEPDGTVTVRAELRRAGVAVASRTATTSFARDRVVALGLCVSRACASGACATIEAPGATLPSWSGGALGSPCMGPLDGGPDGEVDAGPDADASPGPEPFGHAVLHLSVNDRGIFLHRVAVRRDAVLESLSDAYDDAFDPLAWTEDRAAALSPDGRIIAVDLQRGSCVGYSCLFVGPFDDPAALRPMRAPSRPDSLLHGVNPAVANDAAFVVLEESREGTGHAYDLWITRPVRDYWEEPVLLTGGSTWQFNMRPRLSPDQTRVLFSCADALYGPDSICEVGIDGAGFRVVLEPGDAPPPFVADPRESLDSPRYAPDGSLVFATSWGNGSQLWRLPAGGGLPDVLHAPDLRDLGQPCVLPDGHVIAVHHQTGEAPGPTLAVLAPDGELAFELSIDWQEGLYAWLTGCGA